MATFTSTQSGDWNDGGTWGNSSPGVKGTDWPGAAGDVANVGHSVCYNVSETNEVGDVNITSGGDLYFSGSTNTKLTFGDADLNVNTWATLNVGRSGDIIPSSWTAEIYWNPTGDNDYGLQGSRTNGINFYGDGAYYGSSYLAYMANTWQGGQTFTLSGNLYDKWLAGQTLVLHKYGASYGNYLTDLFLCTISSIWNDGGNTSILINEAAPGSSNVFNAGGRVLHVSRNVMIGKLNAGTAIGCLNTLRPEVDVSETTSAEHFVMDNAVFNGFHHIECDNGVRGRNSVFRNGYYGWYHIGKSQSDDCIWFSLSNAHYTNTIDKHINAFLFGNLYGVYLCDNNEYSSLTMYSNATGMRDGYGTRITGLVYGNGIGFRSITHYYDLALNGYGNQNYMQYPNEVHFKNGAIGHDENGNYKPNSNDFIYNQYNRTYVCHTVVSSPLKHLYRNQVTMDGGVWFANFDEIPNNLLVNHAFYDLSKNDTVVRSGGANETFEVTPLSNIAINKSYIIEDWYEYDLDISEEISRIIYVMGTGWSTFPESGRLCLEVEYYDQSSGAHCGTVVSTGLLSANSEWTPLQVDFTAAQSWNARYKLYLNTWESGAKIFVDNQIRSEL